jgi:hypothetical protein
MCKITHQVDTRWILLDAYGVHGTKASAFSSLFGCEIVLSVYTKTPWYFQSEKALRLFASMRSWR